MCVVVALMLAGMFYATKPAADRNEVVFNKRAILAAVGNYLPKPLASMSDEEVLQVFDNQVKPLALNMQGEEVPEVQADQIDMGKERKKPESDRLLPFFIYSAENGDQYYIMSVRGMKFGAILH
jgi:Na+-transporting NADH:ubiquinone oxidoreductase subunit NqrC